MENVKKAALFPTQMKHTLNECVHRPMTHTPHSAPFFTILT